MNVCISDVQNTSKKDVIKNVQSGSSVDVFSKYAYVERRLLDINVLSLSGLLLIAK